MTVTFDQLYRSVPFQSSELEHHYGNNVHLLSDPFLLSHLNRLCHPSTFQPVIHQLTRSIYFSLLHLVLNKEFERTRLDSPTRMTTLHPNEAVYSGEVIDREQKVVCVNLARAGTYPSHICYDELNYILDPRYVRQDHISLNRTTDENDQVTGTNVGGLKIGGAIDDAIVILPDPMGATGSTLVSALNVYKKLGRAKKYIALHLIVTPEYLKRVSQVHSDLIIYAVRFDRGLSDPKVYSSEPGKYRDLERGLNDRQYIVPGAGGFGEIFNNADK